MIPVRYERGIRDQWFDKDGNQENKWTEEIGLVNPSEGVRKFVVLLYIAARNFIRVQYVLKTRVKMNMYMQK